MDPYCELLRAFGGEDASAPGPVLLGQVVQSGGGAPLKVRCAGLPPLDGEDLMVNAALDWTWGEDTGGAALLRAGDTVVLLTQDGQSFYLVCKVVDAGG